MTTRIADFYWVFVWGALGFGVPETLALATGHPQYTLSETVWRVFDVLPGQTIKQWTITHFLLFAGMVWLFGHFVFRVWYTFRIHSLHR